MELSVISVENIKPFSGAATHEWKPYSLSMLDQLMPSVYSPLIYFYPLKSNHNTSNLKLVSSNLKSSLSKTLDPFHPLSGRVNDQNMFIHNFNQGVPFTETRIRGQTLFDFLQPPKMELLNNLLPLEPLCPLPTNGPQVAVQLNTFDCGGMALGLSFYHRIVDGATLSAFLKTWAATANPAGNLKAVHPDLDIASSVFPPRDSIPPQKTPTTEEMSQLIRTKPRRFVFRNDAVSALRSIARSDQVENPSRTEALFAFIWESTMRAATETGSPKLLHLLQAVNIRPRMGQKLSKNSIGNLTTTPIVSCNESAGIKEMVALIRKGVDGIDEKYLNSISRDEWFSGVTGEDLEISHQQQQQQQLLVCSSWAGFGYNDFDFGLGNPIWTGLYGRATGGASSILLKEVGARSNGNNNGIEAWITLDENVMAALERNPDFLKFASPNPLIVFN